MSPKLKRILGFSSISLALLGSVGTTLYYGPKLIRAASYGYQESRLPVAKQSSHNDLTISKLKDRRAVQSSKIISGPGTIKDISLRPTGGSGYNQDYYNFQSGSPKHNNPNFEGSYPYKTGQGSLYPGRRFDEFNIGYYHTQLARTELENYSGSSKVMVDELPNNEPSSPIVVKYPNSATLAGHGKVSVEMIIDHIQYYKPWRYGHSIVFSHNLGAGFRYNGVKSMHVSYKFFDKKGNQITNLGHSHMNFYHLDGESKFGYGPGYSNGVTEDSRNNESYVNMVDKYHGLPGVKSDKHKETFADVMSPEHDNGVFQHGVNKGTRVHYADSNNPADYVELDGVYHRKDEKTSKGDTWGEAAKHDSAIKDAGHGLGRMITYYSKNSHEQVYYPLATTLNNYVTNTSKKSTVDDVLENLQHSTQGHFDPTAQFVNTGNTSTKEYALSNNSNIRQFKGTPFDNDIGQETIGGEYATPYPGGTDPSNGVGFDIDGSSADFTTGSAMGYGLIKPRTKGILPKTPLKKTASTTSVSYKNPKPYYYTIKGTVTGSKSYDFWDKVPNEDSITGFSDNNQKLPLKKSGDEVKMDLSGKRLTQLDGKHYSFRINVDPNHIPRDLSPYNDDADKGPTKNGNTYTYYNRAHVKEQTPKSHTISTDYVPTRVKKNVPKKRVPNPNPPANPGPGKIHKTVDKHIIYKPGAKDTYTLTGTIPTYFKGFTYSTSSYTDSKGNSHSYQYPTGEKWGNDYRFYDNMPHDVSVTGVHGTYGGSASGNRVSFNHRYDTTTGLGGHPADEHYTIKINVKADHLPKIQQGSEQNTNHDQGGHDTPKGQGWYTFWNQGHANDDRHSEKSNWTPVSIRKEIYKIWHYDYDWKGEFSSGAGHNFPYGKVTPNNGKCGYGNWEYHKYFQDESKVPNGDILDTPQGYKMPQQKFAYPMKSTTGYAYQGSHLKIPTYDLQYKTYKDPEGHMVEDPNSTTGKLIRVRNQWRYRYEYGKKQYATPLVGYCGTDDITKAKRNSNFKQSFYLPYFVPRAKTGITTTPKHNPGSPDNPGGKTPSKASFERLIVDTAKRGDNGKYGKGLPFKFDIEDSSYLYHLFEEYGGGAAVRVNITTPGNNGNVSLYRGQVSLIDAAKTALSQGRHAHHSVEFTGHLGDGKGGTSAIPAKYKPGDKVPLKVHVSYTNPDKIQVDTHDLVSHGFIASERTTNGSNTGDKHNPTKNSQDFDGDTADTIDPERTVKYLGEPHVRTLYERLRVTQERHASAKTGYGIKIGHDLNLEYQGHLHAKDYGEGGTDMDFAFPRIWDQDTATQKKDSAIHYPDDKYGHTSYGAESPNSNAYKTGAEMLTDAFEHTATKDGDIHNVHDLDTVINKLPSELDSITDWDDSEAQDAKEVDSLFDDKFPSDMSEGTYKTDYNFYPRKSARDKSDPNDPNGNTYLSSSSDPFAKSPSAPFGAVDGSNRLYTPYWLAIDGANGIVSGESRTPFDGIYPNYFEKRDKSQSNKGRLGGNWLNVDEERDILMYAHNALSKISKSGRNERDDEISVQPYLPSNSDPGMKFHGQTINNANSGKHGFSSSQNNALKSDSHLTDTF